LPQYPSLAIIIPVLNEEEIIAKTLQKTSKYAQTIVVDNGSTDQSAQISYQSGAHVIKESRRGYGRSVLAGILEARKLNKDIAVVLDADLSNDPKDIPLIVEPILNQQFDICLAARSRKADQRFLEPHQRFGNHLATTLISIFTGYQYADLAPFRAFCIPKILSLDMSDPTFGWNIEMQMKAVQHNLRIHEIEIPYYPRQAGESKISGTLTASVKAGIVIIKTAFRYSS